MSYRNPTPEDWFAELERGLEFRRRFGLEDLWGQFEAIYYNVHESMMNDGPNIFLSQGDAMLSTVTVPSPAVRVKATKPQEVQPAPMVESLSNKFLRDLNLPIEVETAVLHAWLFGRGIIKSGYDSEWGYDPELDIGGQLQMGMTFTQLNAQGSRRIEYNSDISPGNPWSKAVMPHDIVVPWGTTDLDTCPWIAHRVIRQIDDLKADRKYENTRKLRGQISMQDFYDSYRTAQAGKLRSYQMRSNSGAIRQRVTDHVEMWEIMDRRTGRIQVVTRDCTEYLRNETNSLQLDNKLPYSSIAFTPRTRSFWTTPDAYYLYYVQSELSDVAVQRTKERRISVLKFLYDSDAISEPELEKILSTDVGVAAKVEGGTDLSKVIQKLDTSPNMQLAQEEELLRANAREQVGFSRNQLGEYQSGRKTASEVQAVESSSKLRMSRRGLQVKRLYEDTIRNINSIVFSYWTMPRYVEVFGPDGAQQWMQVNGPSLKGRYDYQIELTESSELESRKMQALQLYSMLGQDPTINPVELRNFLANQINDPMFSRLFNANIPNAVSQMPPDGRGIPPQAGGGNRAAASPVSQLLNQNGQANLPPSTRLLAGGRIGP